MNKTHEELAREAATAFEIAQDRHTWSIYEQADAQRIILAAITAAVQAEREQSRAVLEAIRERCKLPAWNVNHDVDKLATAELARLSLNDSPPALSKDA